MDKTVIKAFGVFELLVQRGRPVGVTELSEELGLQKSNVHRVLSTLVHLRYVRKNSAGFYEPTLRAWEVGQHVFADFSIARVARPHMRQLVEITGETANLAVFDEVDVVYLDKVESPNPVRAYTVVGGRAPAYCTASGKALIAYQDAPVVEAVAKQIKVSPIAKIKTLAELRREIEFVRKAGYATNIGEFPPNVASIAAPVRNGRGEVVAAVGISGPLHRLQPRKIKSLVPAVIECADNIRQAMGAMTSSDEARDFRGAEQDSQRRS